MKNGREFFFVCSGGCVKGRRQGSIFISGQKVKVKRAFPLSEKSISFKISKIAGSSEGCIFSKLSLAVDSGYVHINQILSSLLQLRKAESCLIQ